MQLPEAIETHLQREVNRRASNPDYRGWYAAAWLAPDGTVHAAPNNDHCSFRPPEAGPADGFGYTPMFRHGYVRLALWGEGRELTAEYRKVLREDTWDNYAGRWTRGAEIPTPEATDAQVQTLRELVQRFKPTGLCGYTHFTQTPPSDADIHAVLYRQEANA